jgi:hypothetical protein
MTGSVHIAMLVIGRLLLGVFVGLITGTAPIYAAEIAKAKERGRISYAHSSRAADVTELILMPSRRSAAQQVRSSPLRASRRLLTVDR